MGLVLARATEVPAVHTRESQPLTHSAGIIGRWAGRANWDRSSIVASPPSPRYAPSV